MPRIPNPKIGFLIQTPPAGDANIWDDYIETDFKGGLCSPLSAYTFLPRQYGFDSASYLAGAQALMQGSPAAKPPVPPADVIVTAGKVAAQACYDATNANGNSIPVVVASAGDLDDLTPSNLTGCTNGQFDPDIVQARINFMQQQLHPTGVAVVGNYDVGPVGKAMDYVQAQLGLADDQVVDVSPTTNFQTLQTVLAGLKQQHNVNVLYVCSDPFLRTKGNDLVGLAHGHALGMTTMHEFGEWVHHSHGDHAYGPDFSKLFQRAAGYVDQIINGADPAGLPVFAPLPVDCVPTPIPIDVP